MTAHAPAARVRWMCALALPFALVACAEENPPPPPATFERPGDVAFVCLEKTKEGRHEPIPYHADDRYSPCRTRTLTSDLFAMHALVTQTTRGEVAVVNMERGNGKGVVLDARQDIPGHTFVPVGEFPEAIVVPNQHPDLDPDQHPGVAYVANFGSRDIYALSISTMVDLNAGETAVLQVVPVRVPDGMDSERGGPFDMVVSPSGDALLVSVPESSVVLRMPIRPCVAPETECILTDQIQIIPLAASRDRAVAAPAPPTGPEPYQRQCGAFEYAEVPAAEPPTLPDDLLLIEPFPTGLALDSFCADDDASCPRILVVADGALPIIHRIDLNAFAGGMLADPTSAILDPWVSGATTSDVAVTPRVPRSLEATGDDTQYVYAIDAIERTVLVMQDGALLHPNSDPGQPSDRVPLGLSFNGVLGSPRAAALEIVTPDFDDVEGGDQYVSENVCTDDANSKQNPARLRGVFLAVAISDATVRIVDVHDMELASSAQDRATYDDDLKAYNALPADKKDDATEPSPPEPCRACPTSTEERPGNTPLVVRHLPRLANNYLNADDDVESLAAAVADVNVVFDTQAFDVRSDGTTSTSTLPALECIACTDPLQRAYPKNQAEPDAGQSMMEGDGTAVDAGAGSDISTCPGETPALLCAIADPWVRMDGYWELVYEGAIPLANGEITGHRGAFRPEGTTGNESTTLDFVSEIDNCKSGILGDDDVPEGTRGDAVEIVSKLPDQDSYPDDYTEEQLENCKLLRSALENDDEYRIRFAIRRAYQDYLVLEEQTIDEAEDLPRSYTVIQDCMNGRLMEFQIRTHDAYRVYGGVSGFESPTVTSGGSQRCVRDPEADPLLQGRAIPGELFRNRFFEITPLEPAAGGGTQPGTKIEIGLGASSSAVLFNATPANDSDTSVVPAELRYLDIEERMFLIDSHQLGLVPIRLDPVRGSQPVQ